MVSDASSVSSFSSLDNVSRSNMLRRQREAALRRRQTPFPPINKSDSFSSDGGSSRPASSHRMGSMTTSAMADVLAWEEAKTKERIEARIKDEELQRVEEAKRMAEMTKAAERRAELAKVAEVEAEATRRAERERFEREEKAREEATALRIEEEARRLVQAKADAERLEKERLADELTKRADLERLKKELIRERLEKERLFVAAKAKVEAERLERERQHARMMEQQSMELRYRAQIVQGGDMNGSVDHATFNNPSFQRASYPSNNGHVDGNGMRMIQQQEPHPQMNRQMVPEHLSQPMPMCNEKNYGHFSPDMMGSNDGYQRYLTTFHQPAPVTGGSIRGESREDSTIISELTEGNSPAPTAFPQAEKNATLNTSNNTELKGSKMKRSTSSRTLSFTEISEADRSNRNQDSAEGIPSESSKEEGGKTTSKEEVSKSTSSKTTSLKQYKSIEHVNLDDPKAMRSFLMEPCPKGAGRVECCIRRSKGIKKALFPEYRIYLKSNNSKTETFLMTSKKRTGNKSSNYLISMNRNDHDKKSDSILGKLRSNFLGTEYTIYDHGKNPDYEDNDDKNDEAIRCELGAILYAATTSLGAKGPRKMKVCINKVDDDGNPLKVWRPNGDDERMLTCFKKETFYVDKLVCLENKPPSWNDEVGAYVLNFNGRVTQASVKNFQLYEQKDEQNQFMQFGRTGKDEFSLDVQWPMSLYQAFAVALSSFDSKLGCD